MIALSPRHQVFSFILLFSVLTNLPTGFCTPAGSVLLGLADMQAFRPCYNIYFERDSATKWSMWTGIPWRLTLTVVEKPLDLCIHHVAEMTDKWVKNCDAVCLGFLGAWDGKGLA